MQGRLNKNDVSNRVNVEEADEVRIAVTRLLASRYPSDDFGKLTRVFDHVKAMYAGAYPGYLACDTPYHDVRHVLDAALATARLIEGHDRTQPFVERLGPRRAMLGVIIALLHDSGLLKRTTESDVENGAVFTKVHIGRSANFMLDYLPTLGFAAEAPLAAKLVHFTGYELDITNLEVEDPRDHVLGCIVGTADLLAQMADRTYLEKCRDFLYPEFVWGGVARMTLPDGSEVITYSSPDDLLLKTPDYYENVLCKRIDHSLGGVDRYAEAHFGGVNLYRSEIETKMRFLRAAIRDGELDQVRRACYSLSTPAGNISSAPA
jgi:hypothetical protein